MKCQLPNFYTSFMPFFLRNFSLGIIVLFTHQLAGQSCGFDNIELSRVDCKNLDTLQLTLSLEKNELAPLAGEILVDLLTNAFSFPVNPDSSFQNIQIAGTPQDLAMGLLSFSVFPTCQIALDTVFNFDQIDCNIIDGLVWEDANFDGVHQAEELGLEDIEIQLLDCVNNVLATTYTSGSGRYQFQFFPNGEYQVRIIPPTATYLEFSPIGNSGVVGTSSDVDESGRSTCLEWSKNEVSIDAGIIFCPPLSSLACNNSLNVALDRNTCETKVTPDMLLTGSVPCLSALEVRLFDESGFIGDVLNANHIGKTINAFTVDLQTEAVCITSLNVIDNTAPEIACTPMIDDISRLEEVQLITGDLNGANETLTAQNFSCWLGSDLPNDMLDDAQYFDQLPFSVTQSDIYQLILFTDFNGGGGAIIDGIFDPFNPCSQTIKTATGIGPDLSIHQLSSFGANIDSWISSQMSPIFTITTPLVKGRDYQLITTTTEGGQPGQFTWVVVPADEGRLIAQATDLPFEVVTGAVTYDLLCTDIDSIINRNDRLAMAEVPATIDNCGQEVILTFQDEIGRESVCGPSNLIRQFMATDESGNSSICEQEIMIRRPSEDDIHLPPSIVFLDCESEMIYDPNGNPHPSTSGYPFIWTAFGPQRVDSNYCNVVGDYSDEIRIDVCEASYTVVREWTIFNWCNLSNTIVFTQYIHVEDRNPPRIDLNTLALDEQSQPDTFKFTTGAFSCSGSFPVPIPDLVDFCGTDLTLVVELIQEQEVPIISNGVVVGTNLDTLLVQTVTAGANYVAVDLPQGCYWFRYVATDDCGNRSTATYPFCVEDQIAPVAVCGNQMTISLGGNGLGRILAQNIDQGSFDACGVANIEVRRSTILPNGCVEGLSEVQDFAPYVDFYCCDIGTPVEVELRVTDIFGNTNSCWVDINVEDKINPICNPPQDLTVDCTTLPANFDPQDLSQLQTLFGIPAGNDNCSIAGFSENTPTVNLDNCGIGTIRRSFTVADPAGNSSSICEQTITIFQVHNYELKFPKDRTTVCAEPPVDSVTVNELGCDLLAINVVDETFSASQDACFKIFRTYTVINWCEYVDTSDPVVIRRDEDCNGSVGDQDVWVIRRNTQSYIDLDNDETNSNPTNAIKGTNCDGTTNPKGYWRTIESNGYWQYTQVIKVVDETSPTISFTTVDPFCSLDATTCLGTVQLDFAVIESCSAENLSIELFFDADRDGIIDRVLDGLLEGSYPNYSIMDRFEIGNHQIEVRVEDGCGNKVIELLPFEVVDCKAPSILCLGGLSVVLSPLEEETDINGDGQSDRGAVLVRAEDLVSDISEDCSGDIRLSINRVGELPSPEQSALWLTCSDSASAQVEIVVWDSANNPYSILPDSAIGGPNYSKCTSVITIEDGNLNLCQSIAGAITGTIRTFDNRRMEDVEVSLSGEIQDLQITMASGSFAFEQLFEGFDYTITPSYEVDFRNGVSTFDLIIISKHILGVRPMESPYMLIAADANNSGTVSTLDIIKLRKLILGIESTIPENSSWRFVDANYDFPIDRNPWFEPFPESIQINNLIGEVKGIDFVGIKIGDVNQSASLINIESNEVLIRSAAPSLTMHTNATSFKPGDILEVPIVLNLSQVGGLQFGLGFDVHDLKLLEVVPSIIAIDEMNTYMQDRGVLTFSWFNNGQLWSEQQESLLFTVRFLAKQASTLEESLNLNDEITLSEYYAEDLETGRLTLSFIDKTVLEEKLALFPNPARSMTNLRAKVGESSRIDIWIRNVHGQQLRHMQFELFPGNQNIPISLDGIPAGVLWFDVKGESFQQAIKLVHEP